jgi:hypothetical protein
MQPVACDLCLECAAHARGPGHVERTRREQDCRPEVEVVAGLRKNRAALLQRDDLVVPPGRIALRGRVVPDTACHEEQERVAKKARPVLRDAGSHALNVAPRPPNTKPAGVRTAAKPNTRVNGGLRSPAEWARHRG